MSGKQDKRTRILRAAVKVFARKGFYNARVSEIAKNAGVADGTIYLYFRNKDEMLILIFEEEMEKFIERIRQEIAATAGILDRLRVFIRTHLEFVRKNPQLAQVFQLELRQSNKFIKEYSGTKLREYLDVIAEIIVDGQKSGIFRPDIPPGLFKRALFGALDEIATHWVLSKNGRYDLAESAGYLCDLFTGGIQSKAQKSEKRE